MIPRIHECTLLASAAFIPLLALTHCGQGNVRSNAIVMVGQVSVQAAWTPCTTVGDCDKSVLSNGAMPACAATATCGADGYCHYTGNPGSTCIEPEIEYCDPDGGHPECNPATKEVWPIDAAACGTKQCGVNSGTSLKNTTCTWSMGPCVAP